MKLLPLLFSILVLAFASCLKESSELAETTTSFSSTIDGELHHFQRAKASIKRENCVPFLKEISAAIGSDGPMIKPLNFPIYGDLYLNLIELI